MIKGIARIASQVWHGVRFVTGDDAYERYLEHHRRHHVDARPMDRDAFYRAELERRWSGINRCC